MIDPAMAAHLARERQRELVREGEEARLTHEARIARKSQMSAHDKRDQAEFTPHGALPEGA